MPIVPNTLERLLTFQLNRAPGPLVDIFDAVAFRVVLTNLLKTPGNSLINATT